ncbi:MAG TPA: methylmalonyl-CoA mutase family protein [Saprospiraceae bacterium]|nr:methylmalonyl-CoA mutase family protein [Saprospiraceae bacterium]
MTAIWDFPSISREQWIESIKKELKGRSWDEQFVSLTEKLQVPPAYHSEEVSQQEWTPLTGHHHAQALPGINFKDSALNQSNKQMLQALKHGVQAPGIVKTSKEQADVEIIFKNVHPDMLEWHLFGYSEEDKLVQFLRSNGASCVLHWAPLDSTDINVRLESFIDRLYAFDQSRKEDSFHYHCRTGTQYLTEIAVLRAMRRIFENYKAATRLKKTDFCLSTTNAINPLSEDPYTQMVANSTMAMSAMIAGADRISLDVLFEEKQELQNRMAINLIQILKMESHLNKVRDPLAGSYWIEKATDSLAAHYWQSFQSRYQ